MADTLHPPALGEVTITPATGQAGTWGTWVVTFTVGQAGIATGGGIQVELPLRWHQWGRNSARRVQTTDPTAPFYISARTHRPEVRLRCEMAGAQQPQVRSDEREMFRFTGVADANAEYVKTRRPHLGSPHGHRYGWVVSVTVTEGQLRPGDTVEVVFGDMSQGGRGFTPPLWIGSPERVRAAVDPTGSGEYILLPEHALPLLATTPGPAVELLIVLPSRTVVNEPATLRLVALDQFQNPVPTPETAVYLVVEEGAAVLRENPVKLGDASTWGCRLVSLTPTQEGVLRVRGTSADGRLFSHSNASKVFAAPPAERLYWGDLHSHSQYSWDGTGTADDHFKYARYAALLDIYSATDHNDRTSMGEAEWQENIRYTEKWYLPGEFVTLLGYEASYGKPYGHHNVYYRGATGEYRQIEEEKLEDIWKRGVVGEMLTIPHHTGGFSRPGGGVNHDWSLDDPRFRTTIEIYSSHGHSEEYAPNHPLSMDVSDFTFNGPGDPGNYVQDAWLAGLKLGVIASSDNHAAQPGKEGFGAMAVWAPTLTREAIFDAIRYRRTYGTTGSRIYLEFFLNGEPMGGEVALAPGEPVHIQVEVLGTGPLRWVEVLRADLDHPQAGFTVVYRDWFAGGSAPLNHRLEWSDPNPPARGLYYVRTRQRDLVHGRVAEAWSSPVWVQQG